MMMSLRNTRIRYTNAEYLLELLYNIYLHIVERIKSLTSEF